MESPDEWRRRMRHEQERRDDRQRQDQQRREDQRKRDEAERRRRSDEQARLAEEKRHNRAMEAARARDSAAPRADPSASRQRSAAPSYNEPLRAPRRKGGFTKLIILIALVWGAIHFWPELSGMARDALASEHTQSSESTADDTTVQSEPQVDARTAPAKAVPVRHAKRPVKRYPRCSATITDQCQQDH